MTTKLLTFEGIVENGQVRLTTPAHLPEGARVVIVVADIQREAIARIYSPRLKDRTQIHEFDMEVLEQNNEGGTFPVKNGMS